LPELKNKKHELFARNLVKYKFNQTKAYAATYPDSSYRAAQPDSSRLLNAITTDRALEIMNEVDGASLSSLIKSLKDDLTATKPIIVKGKIKYVRDNATIWDVKKSLLFKAYCVGNDKKERMEVQNVNMLVNQFESEKVIKSIERLTKLHEKQGLRAIKVV